jgi:hypothetical protein
MSFVVRSVSQEVSDGLRWHLEPFRRPRPGPVPVECQVYVDEMDADLDPPMLSLYIGGTRVSRTPEAWRLVDNASWEIEQRVLGSVKDYLLFHAAVVGLPTGQTLVLPAPTGRGKSTLVAGLILRGFTYLSDELAPLDPITRRIYPYERPIALHRSSVDLLPGLSSRITRPPLDRNGDLPFLRPEDAGGVVGRPGAPLAVIVPSADRGGEPDLQPVSAAEAVTELVANAVNLPTYGERGLRLLSEVVQGAEAHRLTGGDVWDRADLLAERFLRS